ncbi:hypothetical protein QFW77_05710 [Luteimonas sp. RD2P54]|uniref:LuxR family transcriptional regulator n=1 Tax=Luteimonas endophytica TaxID=3042023 RepID=A0ABT6J6Q3_9GAMM|nr:hypothetical protein [Luteimonas endophytica]MDH5822486.1 hypothetical protein [Luteimonas endophytica]
MVALMIAVSPELARAAEPPALLGTWSADVSQLPMPPEARPKRVLISFDEAAGGARKIRVEIVQADGQERISEAIVPLDGSTAAIEGDRLEADAIAVKQAVADVLVMALAKGGVPASTRVYAVTADGERMVETAVHFDADGKAVMRTFLFRRVAARSD